MTANNLLAMLPNTLLEELAIESGVNKYSKKLQGEVVFKLLLYCLTTHKTNSLRTMQSSYESIVFQYLNGNPTSKISHSSISDRLNTIKPEYFELLFNTCVSTYKKLLGNEINDFLKFDSTIVTESAKLMNIGYNTGGDSVNHKQLKFTIGFNELPVAVDFYYEKSYTSENKALKETILRVNDTETITLFDKGITSRNTFDEFTDKGLKFVSKIGNNSKMEIGIKNKLKKQIKSKTLKITSDSWCYLFGTNKVKSKNLFRIIEAIIIKTKEPITFITNIEDADTLDITEYYRKRWDIEVFFKYIKQELNFSKFICRTENGIKVILYSTLIVAILLLVYKKLNKIKSFKYAKQKFAQELEFEIIKLIIELSGGNKDKLPEILGFPPNLKSSEQ